MDECQRLRARIAALESEVDRLEDLLRTAPVAGAEAVLESANAGFLAFDSQFRFIYVNAAGEELCGKSRDQLLGQVAWDVFPTVKGTEVESNILRVMQERTPLVFEYAAEPQQKWYESRVSPGSWGGIAVWFTDVSERKIAEREIQETARRLELVTASARQGIWDWDLETGKLFWDARMCELYGIAGSAVPSSFETWKASVHPDDLPGVVEAAQAAIQGEREFHWQFRIILPTGAVKLIRSDGVVIRGADGKAERMIGASRDVTAQVAAEEKLRESEERFRGAVMAAPFPAMIHADDGRVLLMNTAWSHESGYLPEEIPTTAVWTERAQADSKLEVDRQIEALYSLTGRRDAGEAAIRTKSGEVRLWHFGSAPLGRFSDGVRQVISMAVDVTDRVRAEEALRESEAKYRAVVESMQDVYYRTDMEGNLLMTSPSAARVFGMESVDEFVSVNLVRDGILSQEETDRFFVEMGAKGVVKDFEMSAHRKDGSLIFISTNSHVYTDSSGNPAGVEGVFRDITERRQAEDERAKLEEHVRQAQKLESVGRLAGGVAHDFNNLLTVINGYSDLVLRQLNERDPLYSKLTQIRSAGQRAAELTRQLLAFSRKQIIQPKPVDLNSMISGTREMLQRMVGEDVDLVTSLKASPALVFADQGQLHQVLMNLVVNARDAMTEGGVLTIETANVDLEARADSRPGGLSGPCVLLAVSDTGVGMDHGTLQHIFEPFFTTKAEGEGTGLGLSTVYGIVRQLGGEIRAYSEPGQGASFRIYLPLLEATADAAPAAPPEDVPLYGSETILVVEDQPEVRRLAVAVLQSYGYRVLEAPHGGEALLTVESYAGPIHLMLTDVVMPRMTGKVLAERVQPLRPDMRVLYMSGYAADVMTRQGVFEPGMAYIDKPFTPEGLARKVREVLRPGVAAGKVLVVDDEESIRRLFHQVLTDAGYEVTLAADGDEALKKLRREPFDAVVTDLVMPEREGIEIIRSVRAERPGVKILAVSGAFGGGYLRAAELLGADATMVKPVSPDKLLAVLSRLLGEGSQ